MEHTCRKCGERKNVKKFRRHHKEGPYEPWNLRICKDCVHSEYLDRYSDEDKRDALKKSSLEWKKNNPEHHAAINKKWYHANKHKARASSKLRYAIRRGKIERLPCEVCGTTHKVQGHHDSYKEGHELDVRWLCQDHHKAWHWILDNVDRRKSLDARFEFFIKTHS